MKLTKYPRSKIIKNKWCVSVEWMSGDADAHETVIYTYNSKAEFVDAVKMFERIFKFREEYHNLFCDVCCHHTKTELIDSVSDCPSIIPVIEALYGGHERFTDRLWEVKIEPTYDVTNSQFMACPLAFEDLYCFDEQGEKFKVTL